MLRLLRVWAYSLQDTLRAADPRPVALLLGVIELCWAGVLLLPGVLGTAPSYQYLAAIPAEVWAAIALGTGTVRIIGLADPRYRYLRGLALRGGLFFWLTVAVSFWLSCLGAGVCNTAMATYGCLFLANVWLAYRMPRSPQYVRDMLREQDEDGGLQ